MKMIVKCRAMIMAHGISICLAVMMLNPVCILEAQQQKQNIGYLIQKVETFNSWFYIPFKHKYVLPYFYGFYVVNEETLQSYFEYDSVNYEQAIMLCDPAYVMFSDSVINKEVARNTRIMDVLLLDDSEIYEIGCGKYIIRRIRYSYLDNSQVKVYVKGSNYLLWDDLQDEDTAEYYAPREIGLLYNRGYYQCYHHLIEILPTPEHISKFIWRRLYQLGEIQTNN